jgi:hypothetical protein
MLHNNELVEFTDVEMEWNKSIYLLLYLLVY